jgi:hypothetical protein
MCTLKICRITVAQAENVIAILWRTLEEYGVASPQLRVRQVRQSVELSIEFLSQRDSDLVRRAIAHLAAEAAEN